MNQSSVMPYGPGIFFDYFERTEWTDLHFGAIGRALALAQRFERGCANLAAILGVKYRPADSTDSTSNFQSLTDELLQRRLHQHIASLTRFFGSDASLLRTLNEARAARNEIAHEFTLGFELWLTHLDLKLPERRITELPSLVRSLAEADRVVSLLLSLVTKEPLPVPDFLDKYPDALVKWVCDLE